MTPDLREALKRIKELAVSNGSLTRQSVVSGVWVAALNVSDRIFQLAMVLVVARLIGPEAFGLMGIALLALNAFTQFSRLGLNDALIYNEDENVDSYLDTTLVLNTARGLVIAGVAFLIAPLIATVFGEPRATTVLRALSVGPLIYGLRNPGIVYFRKNLEFQREYVYKVSGAATQFLVAVGYALVFPTVWALVFASLSKRVVQTVISYGIHPYRPSLRFDIERAKELIDYGKWMTTSSITGFLKRQGDDAFTGWFLGAASLGIYQVAYRFATAPNTEVTHVVSRVTFPVYSKLQNDGEQLRKGFYRTVRVTLLISLPVGAGLAAVAPTFVDAFLGAKWTEAVPTLQLLALYGMSVSFGSMFGEVWKAVGRPDLNAKFMAVSLVCIAVTIYPLSARYGVFGVALAIVLPELLVSRPASVVVTARLIDASARRLLRELLYPAAASAIMAGVVWSVRERLALGYPMVEFALLVATGVVVYATLVALLETQLGWGLRSEFRSIRTAFAADDASA